jgi:hypothetical protein
MSSLRDYNIGDRLGNDMLEWKNDDESVQIWSNEQGNRFIIKDADEGRSIKYLHKLNNAIREVYKMTSESSNPVKVLTPSGKVKWVDTKTGFVSRPFGKDDGK